MTDDLREKWTTLDYPILLATARLIEFEHKSAVDAWTIKRTSDFAADDASRALLRLYHGGYVDGMYQSGATGDNVIVERLTERGLREVRIWPNPEEKVAALIDAVEKAANQESDPDQRSRLRRLAQSLRSISEGTLGSIIAAVITRAGGI